MAGTGLLALLDDVTTILDDVAAMSKIAAKKTAGIVGDDLAVNAEGLVGLEPARELPIVGRVALGSAVNKVILVPVALLLPGAWITPLLMIGGAFLCYEGLHKVVHRKDAADAAHEAALRAALRAGPDALREAESKKVWQAIRTDFVLSAEIVAIALGTVAAEPFVTKAAVLSVVAFGVTVAVYGLVAAVVKLDDVGLHLQRKGGGREKLGRGLVAAMPYVMKGLSVVGTLAMFLVGGGILLHGIPGAEAELHHLVEAIGHAALLHSVAGMLASLVVGVVTGGIVLLAVEGLKHLTGRGAPAH